MGQDITEKESGQKKILLIRIWEILRKIGPDRPISLEDVRNILIEEDKASGLLDEQNQNDDRYSMRLIRSNIKAINAAIELPPPDFSVAKSDDGEREKRIALKLSALVVNDKKQVAQDRIEKICIGRDDKEWLYFRNDAFTVDELRFLIDAVQASTFLSEEKTDDICRKLTRLLGEVNPELWKERVVKHSALHLNKSDAFDTIHKIEQAISKEKRLRFEYYVGWNSMKMPAWEVVDNTRFQELDPIAVIYNDGCYYVYGYSHSVQRHRALRIDRMKTVTVTDIPAEYTKERKAFLSEDDDSMERMAAFNMRTSESPVDITFRIPEKLISAMYDKFGLDLQFTKDREKNGCFTFAKKVNYTNSFLGWCAGFVGELEILQPVKARDGFIKFLLANINKVNK